MADFDKNNSWINNNHDTSNISINIKQHIQHGRHRTKYHFVNDTVSFKLNYIYYTFKQLF